jgi:hypothetical protein
VVSESSLSQCASSVKTTCRSRHGGSDAAESVRRHRLDRLCQLVSDVRSLDYEPHVTVRAASIGVHIPTPCYWEHKRGAPLVAGAVPV